VTPLFQRRPDEEFCRSAENQAFLADRIVTIERGRIVEDGSHDELIRSNGRYAKLHYLQAGIHDVR